MARDIRVHEDAVKFLSGLNKRVRDNIIKQLRKLSDDKERKKMDIKKLKGTYSRDDLYRLKVSKHRVVFSVERKTIYITEIFHRERGYR